MQIHSLKLTIQDSISKEGDKIATLFGTLILNTGDVAKTEDGEDRLDVEGQKIPILENIDFIMPVNASKELKQVVQSLIIEVLTKKDMEIAEKNGGLSHYVAAIKGIAPEPEVKAERAPIPVPRKRIKKK